MNTPTSTPVSPFQTPRALLKELQEKFVAFREYMPLTIGIDKQLIALYPELSRKLLRATLGIHTNSLRYLKIMEKATHRFDLQGVAAEEVTDVHRTHATTVLRERAKKVAEQRKAERAAEEAARLAKVAEAAAQQHTEKLNQLASKFSRNS
ncbi:ProQ/FINO family protein [Undibacterium parvum]|jgi:ProP effector|uniref:Osmoprotectant transporter activator n=1 Tax=Undibacterium parvum TaxID=401471 RepID=A0A3Q9BSG0_9BURK|nr:ProQ/FinO family protein [Undibacterium parvum]AZP13222.1 osmoprotectant transporter activator [Undibacterium parvum]MCX7221290.1 ProQ/FinO family protein [Burkholderiales bacterium]